MSVVETATTDDFTSYRDICANRMRRLERYKKAKSFCSLEDEQHNDETMPSSAPPYCVPASVESSAPRFFDRIGSVVESRGSSSCSEDSTPNSEQQSPNPDNTPFDMIKEKMISLMENDVSLLQQLLALGDKISEMKTGMRRTRSERSLEDTRSSKTTDEEDSEREDQFDPCFSASHSAVTTLYVEDEPQFFSRKNSVLRIPIPPRASNRFNRRLPRRTSTILRVDTARPAVSEEISSEGSDGPLSPTLTYSNSTISSCSSHVSGPVACKTRSSTSSIDSGIRDSPTNLSD